MEVVGIDLALEAVFLVVPPQGPEKRKKCKCEKIQRSHFKNSAKWNSWISANEAMKSYHLNKRVYLSIFQKK